MGNISLILSGLIVSLLGITIFISHIKNINLVDIYILCLCQYFGPLSIIDGLSNDYSEFVTTYIILTHALVLSTAIILNLIRIKYQKNIFIFFDIKHLKKIAQNIPINSSRHYLISIFVIYFSIKKYIIGLYIPTDITDTIILQIYIDDSPYWVSVLSMIINPLFILGFIISFINAYEIKKKRFSFIDTLMFFLFVFTTFGQGRTTILIITLLLICFTINGINITKSILKLSFLSFLGFITLILYSNIHQTYRHGTNDDVPIIQAISNFEATLENLQNDRMPMWRFNYLIMEKKWSHSLLPDYPGQISLKVISAAIPSFIYGNSEKPIGDKILSDKFQLFSTDYPSNDVTTLFADFDIFVIFLLPLKFLIITTVFSYIYKKTATYQPFLTLFFFILYFTNIINIEAEFLDFAILLRNTLIYGLFFFTINQIKNIIVPTKYL